MKKITELDKRMLTITEEEDDSKLPTRRGILQLMGNIKAENADEARRTRRILEQLRNKANPNLILQNEDMNLIEKFFEKNNVGLPAWMQGQILDVIDGAERVDTIEITVP